MIEYTPQYADFTIKARCDHPERIETMLKKLNAEYLGEDFQTDTYYDEPIGKLKLREGNIENLLTHYIREGEEDKKKTTVKFYIKDPDVAIKNEILGSRKVIGRIIKRRKIYFIDNVKFHIDQFEAGKTFMEIEAIDREGLLGLDKIRMQCEFYRDALGIQHADIIKDSYIDWMK